MRKLVQKTARRGDVIDPLFVLSLLKRNIEEQENSKIIVVVLVTDDYEDGNNGVNDCHYVDNDDDHFGNGDDDVYDINKDGDSNYEYNGDDVGDSDGSEDTLNAVFCFILKESF